MREINSSNRRKVLLSYPGEFMEEFMDDKKAASAAL